MKPYGNIRASVVAALPALLLALPARAEDGLPQLDTRLFPEQLFWLAITFGILYLLMSFVALPRVASTKENRQHIISTELEAAEAANDSAKAALAALEKSLAVARAQAHEQVTEKLASLATDTAARHAAQAQELKQKLQKAEADIATVREEALKKVQTGAADLAAIIVKAITGSTARGQA